MTVNDQNADIKAFALWVPVYEDCVRFEEKFYRHPDLDWAKKKGFRISAKKFIITICSTALVGALIRDPLTAIIRGVWEFLATKLLP